MYMWKHYADVDASVHIVVQKRLLNGELNLFIYYKTIYRMPQPWLLITMTGTGHDSDCMTTQTLK